MRVRLCRECGEEYRLDAAVQSCSDCGGAIETRERPDPIDKDPDDDPEQGLMGLGPDVDDDADEANPDDDEDQEDDAVEEPMPEVRLLHRGGRGYDEVVPLLKRLAAVEIRFWLRAPMNVLEVHVQPNDYERARSELEVIAGVEGGVDVESGFDAATGYAQCPACGARLEASQFDCPGCGLTVRAAAGDEDEPENCQRCGKSHDEADGGCGCTSR